MCIKYDTYAELRTQHLMCIVCYPHTQNSMSVILRMYIEDDTYAELRTVSMDSMHVDTLLDRHLGS